MITASEARYLVEEYNKECFTQFCSRICKEIKKSSKKGNNKVSVNVPFDVRNSSEYLKIITKDLTDSPNLFKVSFYENNSVIVISWV